MIITLADGREVEAPDDLSPEQIKAIVQKFSAPRVGMGDVKMADAPMQSAANVPASMLTEDPQANWQIAANLASKGLTKAVSKKDALRAAAVAAGLGTGLAGMGPIAGGALGGALIGAGTSPGETAGEVVTDAATSGLLGAGVGAAAKGIGAVAKKALPRAYRLAFKTLNPTASEAAEAEAKLGSWEAAGKVVDESGAAAPWLPGRNMRWRRDILAKLGKDAGAEIEAILTQAEKQGAQVDKSAVIKQVEAVYDKYFGQPGTAGMTSTLRSGAREARRFIDDLITNSQITNVGPAEALKRVTQTEGYLKGGKYADPKVVKKDPAVGFFRESSGALREGVENAVDTLNPDLGSRFKLAKARSGTSQAFTPVASRAANVEFTGDTVLPQHGYSLPSTLFHAVYDPLRSAGQSWLIPANKALQSAYNATPQGSGATFADFLVAALRKKKEEDSAESK